MVKQLLKTLVAVLAIATAATGPARAQSNPTKYTSAVAMSALQEDDTLAEGFSLTGNESNFIYFVANRHKHNENLSGSLENITLDQIQSIGANCVFSTLVNEQSITFAPVDENGQDCDAWVVTEVQSDAGFTNITIAGIRIPGPPRNIRFAEGTEDAANWSLASGNASVPGTQVLQGIMSGSQLTATYSGTRKVKSVIATKHPNPNETPLTIEALTDGTVVVQDPQSGMKYTLNGGTKTAVSGNINVTEGDKVAFYGNSTSYDGTKIAGGTADVKAYGNIMSLVDENGFATATTLTANNAFYYLFDGYAHLKDISGLVLPATTLSQGCYMGMFSDCTGLTTVPSDLLPATTLAPSCYVAMFALCLNLTNVPTLPATTLAQFCYNNMFLADTSLTTVPTDLLPATTLAPSCYSYMFVNCLNLTTAPALPATTLAERCYMSMFTGCENLVAVPDTLPATTLAEKCYYSMFERCENLAASPVLPATTLVDNCYNRMFDGCYNLDSVICRATAGFDAEEPTYNWLNDAGTQVTGAKYFVAEPDAAWTEGVSGIPSGWTRKNPDGSVYVP